MKNEKHKYLKVDQFAKIICPICKETVIRIGDGVSDYDFYPCPHYLFSTAGDLIDFGNEEIEEKFEDAGINGTNIDFDKLEKLGYTGKMFFIEASVSGISCGPSRMKVIHGFVEHKPTF
jgi:hypothetical protein